MSLRTGTLLLLLATSALPARGQQFVEATGLFVTPPDPSIQFNSLTVADFDGDGRADIYHPGRLYRQQEDGRFSDVLQASSISVEGGAPLIALPGDPDADGLLDLLMVDGAPGSRYYQNVNGRRYSLANADRNLNVRTLSRGAVWGDFDSDGYLDIFVASADGQNQLYVTGPDGQFTNVSNTKRTVTAGGICGLAVTDYDRDGDLDVYLPGCAGANQNHLLQFNSVSDRFAPVAASVDVQTPGVSTGAAWLDYDNDGWMDLFVVNTFAEFLPSTNLLFRNVNGTSFQEVASSAQVSGPAGFPKSHAIAADFDNNGWTDLYVASPTSRHRLFMNQGDLTFKEVLYDVIDDVPQTDVMSAADINGDGWIDLIYGSSAGNRVFLNGGDAHWLTLELRNTGTNRLGIGARVEVFAGGLRQTSVMVPGGGNPSHVQSPVIHFGLAGHGTADEIRVTWPDGAVDTYSDIAADGHRILVRGGGLTERPSAFSLTSPVDAAFVDTSAASVTFSWTAAGGPRAASYTLTVDGPGTRLHYPGLNSTSLSVLTSVLPPNQIYRWSVFAWDGLSARTSREEFSFSYGNPERASATLQEPASYDFGLPAVESGGATFLDLDGDLDLDLLVTGVRAGVAVASLYRANDLDQVSAADGAQYIFKGLVDTGAGIEPVFQPTIGVGDLDGDGDPDLILSGLDRNSGLPRLTVFRNSEGNLQAGPLGVQTRWGGPITIADVDGDGDGDVLISGTTAIQPPYNPTTTLYRNDGGSLSEWAEFPGALFGAADWADADLDGDLDLVLVGDAGSGLPWGAVYRNDGATFEPIPIDGLHLLQASARWGDYDGDGDPDIVASGGRLEPELLRGATVLLNQRSAFSFETVQTPLDQVLAGGLAWGDYEGDGDLDLIVTGVPSALGEPMGRVWRNQGGQFLAELDFQGAILGGITVGDYNLDGDLDFLVIGLGPDGKATANLFINQQVAEPVPSDR